MSDLSIRTHPLASSDIEPLVSAFAAIGWNKQRSTFAKYVEEELADMRWTCVAESGNTLAGYVTVAWNSPDPVFAAAKIPEVMDLNVLPPLRRRGIGGRLMTEAESVVAQRLPVIGLRVGLHSGYGAAQRLYVGRGYIPDGTGVIRGGVVIPEQATVILDDDLTLRMTKKLHA